MIIHDILSNCNTKMQISCEMCIRDRALPFEHVLQHRDICRKVHALGGVQGIQQYAKLAKQGVRGENAAAIRTEVEHNACLLYTSRCV